MNVNEKNKLLNKIQLMMHGDSSISLPTDLLCASFLPFCVGSTILDFFVFSWNFWLSP